MSAKLDLKKKYKELYKTPEDKPVFVDVPEFTIVSIEGAGDPNTSEEFKKAVEALYPVVYKIKFASKLVLKKDYAVMPMEGLWWAEDMSKFKQDDKSNWLWKIFIVQPDFITKDMFEDAVEEVREKKNPEFIDRITIEKFKEGKSAQILHLGPYSEEAENIQKVHDFIKENGFSFDGLKQKHHEIYLSDMRRTAPEKLKTIVRQPYI